jgi:hypothetical protein
MLHQDHPLTPAFPGPALCEPLESRLHLDAAEFVLPPGSPPLVRVAYLIPYNRSPQPNAVANLQAALPLMQKWYKEAFARTGLPEKSFLYETLPDALTPKVHVVNVPQADTALRSDTSLTQWNNVNAAASAQGIPLFSQGQNWLLIAEVHTQASDGRFSGNIALGASNGSGADGGVAQVSSHGLPFLSPSMLTDNRAYAGMTFPEIGPHPLVQNVSFPSFEGTTLSQLASVRFGATLHELSHGFGLPHDFRNDANFDGNLMGNGLRGFRGMIHPDLYPQDYAYLQFGQALVMNNSRYFNPATVPETTKPTLTINGGELASGQMRINFTASDSSGLRVAVLTYEGEQVAEIPLSANSVNTSISTPYFTPGQPGDFAVMVYDRYGNRQRQTITLTPAAGNLAPIPKLNTTLHTIRPGQQVTLDVNGSTDPDGSFAQTTVEWDLNDDGTFDTPPSTTKSFATSFAQIGTRMIRARHSDAAGAQSVSAPLPVRVIPLLSGGNEANQYYLRRSPATSLQYEIFLGSSPTGTPITGPLSDTNRLVFNTGGGNDRLTIDFSNGNPLPAGGVSFDAGAGTGDQLHVIGSAGQDVMEIKPDALVITFVAPTVQLAGIEDAQFNLQAGNDELTVRGLTYSPLFNGGPGTDVLYIAAGNYEMKQDARLGNERLYLGVGPGAHVTFASPQHIHSLTLGPDATATANAGAGPIVLRGAPALEPSAKLDIADNPLIIDYDPSTSTPLLTLRAHITSAYQPGPGPHWNGPGITSSQLPSRPHHALGYAEAADVLNLYPGQTAAFASETVDATAVLVRLTPIGDADLDGQVTFLDFQRFERGFGKPDALWPEGDFDYNRQTNYDDFSALFNNFGAPVAAAEVTAPAQTSNVRQAPSYKRYPLGTAIARPKPKPPRRL